jgi:GR25 family glycosyltransferase involved in LPS biosynthesis
MTKNRGMEQRSSNCAPALPVYVISLADAEIRRRNMIARLNAAKIPFRFVDAVDGRYRPVADEIDGARVVHGPDYTEWGIGCTASHRLVHRMIANEASDVALVLEDDAKFSDDFSEVLAGAAKFDFDIFKLEGGNLHRRRATVGQIGRYRVVVRMVPSLGSAAYLIRRTAAIRFCELPVIDRAIDAAFDDSRLKLRVLELDPFPAVQDGETPPLYGITLPPRPRANWARKLVSSMRRRYHIVRLYGPKIAFFLETQRFRRS